MSTGGNQFGSAAQSNPMRSYGQPYPGAGTIGGDPQNRFMERMRYMPSLQGQPTQFGGMGGMPPQQPPMSYPAQSIDRSGEPLTDPHDEAGRSARFGLSQTPQSPSQPVQQIDDRAISSPASAFGIGANPTQNLGTRPMEDRAVASPASAFGIGQNPMAPPMPQGPAPQAPQQNMMNTPWGMQALASLGPSFNAVGSPQGGYFQNNKWTPNVGNARNGLDVLNRFGMNWDGSALNPGLGIR